MFLCREYTTCMLVQIRNAVRDAVLFLACEDCPGDGLLFSLHLEEGSLLLMPLSCSASPPLDGILGRYLNLCSSKVALLMPGVSCYLETIFNLLCCIHSICRVEQQRHELSLRPNPHISNLNNFCSPPNFPTLLALAVSLLLETILH